MKTPSKTLNPKLPNPILESQSFTQVLQKVSAFLQRPGCGRQHLDQCHGPSGLQIEVTVRVL